MNGNKIIHVAYAEDHISMREGVVDSLQKSGNISVDIQANNGIEMLHHLSSAPSLPDICIIDINMPEMDGFSLLVEIKKRWPAMRTLVLTKYSGEPYIIRMIKIGANGYLHKECTMNDIKSALQTIHETGYYYSQIADNKKFTAILNNQVKSVHLSEAETQLLKYVASDLTYKEIAVIMNNTEKGVKASASRLCEKLNVNRRPGLILFAIKYGIVPVDF